ncbi:MAG: hypothetical protein RL129_851 [Actinomycetota bacterium]
MRDFRHTDPYLQKRYGLKTRRLPSWVLIAVALLALGITWTIWSGTHHATPEIRSDLISYKPIDAKSIEVRFTVNLNSPSKAHICTLVARDYEMNVVGQKVEIIEAGTAFRDITTLIPTRLAAVNAAIAGCKVR